MEYAIFYPDGTHVVRTNAIESENIFDIARRQIGPEFELSFYNSRISARYAVVNGLPLKKRYYLYTVKSRRNFIGSPRTPPNRDINPRFPLITGNFVVFSNNGKLDYYEALDIANQIYFKQIEKQKCFPCSKGKSANTPSD